ncbi:GHKL domain-containing protein [Rossellomorea sp. SC111]|uniref:sensor histidine kinase n=1 Tax=Rossellomorea sp. SC111 TaxID=2968985 RepID=UPI00215B2255|nr:GHKL domain-containing protein [Rossellomorea sp. SC111]MCR8847525.1 GHKL domain-containing protein [Rossellomorea sp. SC111]
MKIYWLILSLIGFVHIHALVTNLPWHLPYYFIYPAVFFVTYLYYRKTKIHTFRFDQKWSNLLSLVQLFLLLPYLIIQTPWLSACFFITFIGIEWIRWEVSTKIKVLQKNYEQLEIDQIHLSETFRVVRSERHDFLKHISSIHYMLEHHHHEEAAAYLDDLVDGYEETNLSIKGERGSVAGILHQMYNRGKSCGVTMIYDVDMPLSTLPLPDRKIVTLLGNLLSNSIEASTEWLEHNGNQATISLQFYKRSGLYMLICKNPSLPIAPQILDELYQSHGHTTKKGHEGLGTKIIQETVKEYNGFLDFVYKEEEFTVKIKIPAIH